MAPIEPGPDPNKSFRHGPAFDRPILPRPVTICDDTNTQFNEDELAVFMQKQSPIFRLPRELRDYVYQEAMHGNIVHLTVFRLGDKKIPRLSNCVCQNSDLTITHSAHKDMCLNYHGKALLNPWHGQNLLGPLLACRRLYQETSQGLYKYNTFTIDNQLQGSRLDAFNTLPSALLPRHFQSITTLSISANYYPNTCKCQIMRELPVMYAALRQMRGLRVLTLSIWSRELCHFHWMEDKKELLDPMLDIYPQLDELLVSLLAVAESAWLKEYRVKMPRATLIGNDQKRKDEKRFGMRFVPPRDRSTE
ncbi:uncharacterized protein BCR38DRAFT_486387 [Pseudomassariella vexata]|uniref:DUF7730 domain-containing protein n=1 Tax=Pseudomassariella vexata TaxID=1141098 RepID=A0A1Y2DS63_9PEZI|nr:uncharacterized protein BCR38DRAFT_486387 [Pseudomassariella vexata]ORY62113.1 hypothetical protein BCR38DRAFT_486387 [Pseudomassariella vexata]